MRGAAGATPALRKQLYYFYNAIFLIHIKYVIFIHTTIHIKAISCQVDKIFRCISSFIWIFLFEFLFLYPVIPFRLRQGHQHHKNLTGCGPPFRNFQIKNVPS